MKKAVLIGNYGINNFGDDALREYFTRTFPEVEWTVLVGKKPGVGESVRLPLGFRSLLRPWWRTFSALWNADVAVFGGGTLFTDIESVRACVLWGLHALVSRLTGTPYILAAQGIGPFKTKIGEGIARWVVRHAASVSVRDQESAKRISTWLKNTEVVQVFDPVFPLVKAQNIVIHPQNVLIVIPRLNSGESFYSALMEELSGTQYAAVRIVSLEPHHPQEVRRCSEIRSRVAAHGISVEVFPLLLLKDVASAFAGASRILTQRYHGAIVALSLGIPFRGVRQAAGDKIEQIAREAKDETALQGQISALESELSRFLKS